MPRLQVRVLRCFLLVGLCSYAARLVHLGAPACGGLLILAGTGQWAIILWGLGTFLIFHKSFGNS